MTKSARDEARFEVSGVEALGKQRMKVTDS